MSKVDLARRLFLRRGGVAAAVAPFVPSVLGGQRVSGAYGGNSIGAVPKCGGLVNQPAGIGTNIVMKEYYTTRHNREMEQYGRLRMRERWGGFDPDIAALVSVSPSFKTRMQADREERERRENESFIASLKRRLGLPEDW